MKILFLFLSLPDMDLSSNMYGDLLEEFVNRGHDVFPVAPLQTSGETKLNKERGIEILRVKTGRLFNVNPVRKGIANILLPYQYKKAINKFYSDISFDLVILPTPPITLVEVADYIKKKCNAKIYLLLRDIFPQNAVDLGLIKKSGLLYKYFRKKEKKLYAISDYIGCMSQGNIEYVINHNPEVERSKLHILMNFQKSTTLFSLEKKSDIKQKYGLQDKFVVVFGGNMGIPQQMENVIALAKKCQHQKEVVFLLIGKGTQLEKIRLQAKQQGVNNIILKDYIPREDYQLLISQCDIGLISLNEKFTIPNIPSKVMSYFDVGIPVLASIDKNTDFGEILESISAGLFSIAGDLETFKNNFDTLYSSPQLRQSMGLNGRRYLEKNMTPSIAYKTIISYVS